MNNNDLEVSVSEQQKWEAGPYDSEWGWTLNIGSSEVGLGHDERAQWLVEILREAHNASLLSLQQQLSGSAPSEQKESSADHHARPTEHALGLACAAQIMDEAEAMGTKLAERVWQNVKERIISFESFKHALEPELRGTLANLMAKSDNAPSVSVAPRSSNATSVSSPNPLTPAQADSGETGGV